MIVSLKARERRVSSTAWRGSSADGVYETDLARGQLCDGAQFERAALRGGGKQCRAVACDERVADEAQFVDQSCVEQAGHDAAAADQVDVLAGLLFERGDLGDVAQE